MNEYRFCNRLSGFETWLPLETLLNRVTWSTVLNLSTSVSFFLKVEIIRASVSLRGLNEDVTHLPQSSIDGKYFS